MDKENLCVEGFTVRVKRIILIILMYSIVLGCAPKSDEALFYGIQKQIHKMNSYSCEVEIYVKGNKNEQKYLMKQWFQKPNRYRLEVVSPESLKGKTTISNGIKTWIYHPGIDQTWVTRDFENSKEQNMFLGYFIKNYLNSEDANVYQKKFKGKNYLIIETIIPGNHMYYHKENLWMDLETKKPFLLQVFDAHEELKIEVRYNRFQYNPDLKGDFFKIPEELLNHSEESANIIKKDEQWGEQKMMKLEKVRPVWAEINLDNLAHNIREIRKLVPKETLVTAVVKADGYGHGAVEIAGTLLQNGADRLAVSTLSEAVELRRVVNDVPILILGYTPDSCAEEVIKNNIIQTLYSVEQAKSFSKAAQRLGKEAIIHIKIDTGMSRLGFQPNKETVETIKQIVHLPNIKVEGLFTHFAVADEIDKPFTKLQYEKFIKLSGILEKEGIHIPIKHASNSAGIIDFPEMHLDMVRAGIIVYGIYPSPKIYKESLDLKPALSLRVRITHVKEVEAGTGISYGLKYVTKRKSKIATLPIGYADGFTRMLSGKGEALIKGHKVPIVGSICMDQCMIDVTGIENVKRDDEVILIGSDGVHTISAEDIAEKIGTISYEVICMVGRRVPRVYIKNNQFVKVKDYILD